MYLEQDRVVVRDARGTAVIECHDERFRYRVLTSDVFGYESIRSNLPADADGFVARDDWFAATVDHEYPDAPPSVWDAFHSRVIDPPEVMFTTRDGFYAGDPSFERFITMQSTHGSLNQRNTATFLMSMTGRVRAPLRTRDVMPAIEPSWRPGVIRG